MSKETKFKRGDKLSVKGNDYGSHWFIEYLPKNHNGAKCAMVKVTHCSINEKCFDDVAFGILRDVRLVDVRAAK